MDYENTLLDWILGGIAAVIGFWFYTFILPHYNDPTMVVGETRLGTYEASLKFTNVSLPRIEGQFIVLSCDYRPCFRRYSDSEWVRQPYGESYIRMDEVDENRIKVVGELGPEEFIEIKVQTAKTDIPIIIETPPNDFGVSARLFRDSEIRGFFLLNFYRTTTALVLFGLAIIFALAFRVAQRKRRRAPRNNSNRR